MKVFISMFNRYAEYYYRYRNSLIGLAALCDSFLLAKTMDLIWFQQPYDYVEDDSINSGYQHLLQNKNKQHIAQAIIQMEKRLPYIHQVMQKIDTKAKEEGIDTGFAPSSWAPGIIAVEVL